MISTEHVLYAQKLNAELLFALHAKALEGIEKLVTLNVEATKAALQELADYSRSALTAKDSESLIELQQELLQPAAENAAQYTRQANEIAQETWAGVAQAFVSTASQAPGNLAALIASAVGPAPAGSEGAVEIVKSTMAAATSAYDSMQKAAKATERRTSRPH